MLAKVPIVDTREVNKNLYVPLIEQYGWAMHTCKSGDFVIPAANDKVVGIERKTVKDFVASMQKHKRYKHIRLVNQAKRMVEEYDYCILLLELNTAGTLSRNDSGYNASVGLDWDRIADDLLTIQELGLSLEITLGVEHTVQRLQHLRARFAKSIRTKVQSELAHSPYISALALTPGIGVGRAEKLKEAGIMLQLNKEPDQIARVEGIGKKTAESMVEFWGRGISDGSETTTGT